MYKVLSNLKFMGKLYVKGDEVDLRKKLGDQLIAEGVVETSKKTLSEVKKREEEKRKDEEDKKKKDEEKEAKNYKEMSDKEIVNTLKDREIDYKEMSKEEAIKALERSDKVIDENK